jgi:predicted ATP-binding protein involved in virulence
MPADKNKAPDAMHFRSLRLENVRAFGSLQSLEFEDEKGDISLWNLILGENGVGKTTLMQALAVMLPVSDFPPTRSKAELSEHENDEIMHFIRRGGNRKATMAAVFDADGRPLKILVELKGSVDELDSAKFPPVRHRLRSEGPLVIKYGAGRHFSRDNSAVAEPDATKTSFSEVTALCDAEKILEQLDYAVKSDPDHKNGREKMRLKALKAVVASLLPGRLSDKDIEIRGPRMKGRDQSGVLVQTPSGKTPFGDLSLGYQTMFALTVDLASRLFDAFPKSAEPLSESAIVLIDEVDLHLHPQWQRDLRERLLTNFPKVQFIASTHSPITAQETLSEGGNVAVVRWEKNEAHIFNNPIQRGPWRSDQLLESELFRFGADRSRRVEDQLYERVKLSRKSNRSPAEEARLRKLDKFVESLPTARSPEAETFEELMMNFAKDLPRGVPR